MKKGDIVITGLEAKARVITEEIKGFGVDHDKLGTIIIGIGNAMQADWAYARTRERWVYLANALYNYTAIPPEHGCVKRAFALLVRRGWVRSYTSGGRRLYEVNLS